MISDVLFEAREDILGYLAAGIYGEREHWADIAAVVLAMEKLRLSPGYDISAIRHGAQAPRRSDGVFGSTSGGEERHRRRLRMIPPARVPGRVQQPNSHNLRSRASGNPHSP